jgi:hypothetical protein
MVGICLAYTYVKAYSNLCDVFSRPRPPQHMHIQACVLLEIDYLLLSVKGTF